jgi:hypothetical protein
VSSEDGTVVAGGVGDTGVVDIPVDDDERVQEHDSGGVKSDEVSVAQRSWNEGSFRGKRRWPADPELNLRRPCPGKATVDITNCA